MHLIILLILLWPLTTHASVPLIEELMSDAKALQFDRQGNIAQQLDIKKIFHTKGESITHLVKPKVILKQLDGSTWKITANTGKSLHTKNGNKFTHLELRDHVKIMQFVMNNKEAVWSLATDFMVIYPKTKTIYTPAPIKIDHHNLTISAQGLSGDLKIQKMVLLNHVKTQYRQGS